MPILHFSPSTAAPAGQDPPEENGHSDPTRCHRDTARNHAPPDGTNYAPMRLHAKVENLLLNTSFPKWRGGNHNTAHLLKIAVLPFCTIPQILSQPDTRQSHTARLLQSSREYEPRFIGGGKRSYRLNSTPPRYRTYLRTS